LKQTNKLRGEVALDVKVQSTNAHSMTSSFRVEQEADSKNLFKWGYEINPRDENKIANLKLLLDPDQPRPYYISTDVEAEMADPKNSFKWGYETDQIANLKLLLDPNQPRSYYIPTDVEAEMADSGYEVNPLARKQKSPISVVARPRRARPRPYYIPPDVEAEMAKLPKLPVEAISDYMGAKDAAQVSLGSF
jgi:hypothetical protein